jgi:hypothetical protein
MVGRLFFFTCDVAALAGGYAFTCDVAALAGGYAFTCDVAALAGGYVFVFVYIKHTIRRGFTA